jgi:hypothetical protein
MALSTRPEILYLLCGREAVCVGGWVGGMVGGGGDGGGGGVVVVVVVVVVVAVLLRRRWWWCLSSATWMSLHMRVPARVPA